MRCGASAEFFMLRAKGYSTEEARRIIEGDVVETEGAIVPGTSIVRQSTYTVNEGDQSRRGTYVYNLGETIVREVEGEWGWLETTVVAGLALLAIVVIGASQRDRGLAELQQANDG